MANWWDADPVANQSPHADAISSIESGGNYKATGPVTKNGDRAFGRYQVMGANIKPWSQEILGREVSHTEFMNDPEIQDKIFKGKFGQYAEKYGPEGAAKAWFAGERGMNNPNAKDQLGTSVADYARKFSAYAPEGRVNTVTVKPASGNWWDADPVADAKPQADTFKQRLTGDAASSPSNPSGLQAGLERTAATMRDQARGPATSPPGTELAIDFLNQGSAAGQRTTSDLGQHMPNFISADVHENDAGEVLYRDKSGNLVPTDQNKHVALRDPKDGRIKIFARSEGSDRNALESAGRLAGTGMAAGAPVARPAIASPTTAQIQPRASDVFATSKAPYRAFTEATKDIEIPAETAQGMADRLRTALGKVNLTDEMAGAPAKSALKMLEGGETVTIDLLQRVKRMADRGFGNSEKDVRDGAKAITREIYKIIDEVAPEASKQLKKGNEIHQTALALQDLQRKSDIADLRTGRAGYGGNAVNAMRQVLSPIVQRSIEGKSTLYKPNEIAAMRELVEGTGGVNAARQVSAMSPSKGSIPLATAIVSGSQLGPVALAIPAIGAASNKLATVMTGKQIDRLKELVAKRSPAYAEAVQKAVARYEKAQMEMINDPSPGRLGAYVSASRQLSSGLNRDGISVSSGDLLRAIQGAVPAAAENEQN